MKKISFLCLFLCACVQQANQEENVPLTPLQEYKECMGYSDKTIVHTLENPGRYIVLASEESLDQPYVNKKEQGKIYYTSLLECSVGNSIEKCSDQQSIIIRNIGTKEKWKVGSIKNFTNVDFMFDKIVDVEFLRDGRFVNVTDYCYVDRNNISKTYCGHFIRESDWRADCKSKMLIYNGNK